MENFTKKLLVATKDKVHLRHAPHENMLDNTTESIVIWTEALSKLKEYISAYTFKDSEEEITFFKHIKPQFLSQLIYYNKVFNIETTRPTVSLDTQNEYLKSELAKLKLYFDRYVEIFKYYRTKSNHLDKEYFLRGKPIIHLPHSSFYFERDPIFSTSFDYDIAKIMANEELAKYLNNELKKLEHQESQSLEQLGAGKVFWTGNKSDLVLLIYGWEGLKSFNYGNVTIKELAEFIESAFCVNLGDYYRTFLDLKKKKGNRTKFLNDMIKYLEDRMDQEDNK